MDGVIANFNEKVLELDPSIGTLCPNEENYDERSAMVDIVMKNNPRLFLDLKPIEGGIESVKNLWEHYDVLFLSTPCPHIVECFSDKMTWLYEHFGEMAANRLILSQRKNLSIGDYLVDDRLVNGVAQFTGKHIHFGTEEFPSWREVENHLLSKLN